MVQLLTGHNYLNYHQSKVYPDTDDTCRLCMEDAETAWHVICECPALAVQRLEDFGHPIFLADKKEHPFKWNPRSLLNFALRCDLMELLTPRGRTNTIV